MAALPTAELREKARVELNETDETRVRALVELRDVMFKQHSELARDLSDEFLVRFLRARKFNVDRAVSLLCNYETFRRKHADLFVPLSEAEWKVADEQVSSWCPRFSMLTWLGAHVQTGLFVLPSLSNEGCRGFIACPALLDPLPHRVLLHLLFSVLERFMADPAMQVNGMIIVQNFQNVHMSTVYSLRADFLSVTGEFVSNCLPVRIKHVLMFNPPWFINLVLAIARTIMSSKILSRLTVHGHDVSALQAHFPASTLPPPYGTNNAYHITEQLRQVLAQPSPS